MEYEEWKGGMRIANKKLIIYLFQISDPGIGIREAMEIVKEMEGEKNGNKNKK